MTFTIKTLCDFLGTEVPEELKNKENNNVAGINARYTTLTRGDAFFDINNDCEDLSIINPEICPFIITERDIEPDTLNIPVVKVRGALDLYVKLCKAFVDEYPETTRIAVTGSTGKTSCKETIAAVLGQIAATDKSFSNQNNIYFISKKYQKSMSKKLRFFVQEACVKEYEGINLTDKLAIAFQPKFSVMTNIYDNHAEVYGDRETTFRIKRAIVERLPKDGYALLNFDDVMLKNYHPDCNTVYYSLDNPEADICASNIHVSDSGTKFDIHWQDRIIKNVFCPMIGRPNIYNCIVSFAIGSLCGNDDETIVRAIKKVKLGYSLRQNHIEIGGYKLFVDCFNASLESIEGDMRTMVDLKPSIDGRKVVIIGDVAELGEKASIIHRKIGAVIAKYPMDRYFCFGKYSTDMYEGAIETNSKAEVSSFNNREDLEKAIARYIRPGDLILWKASRDTHIELSIDKIFGTDYYTLYPCNYDKEALVHAVDNRWNLIHTHSRIYYRRGVPFGGIGLTNPRVKSEYCVYANGVKFARYYGVAKHLKMPRMFECAPLNSIGDRAFYKSTLVSIELPDCIVNISTNAFLRSVDLREIKLPENLKFIDFSAFAYCTVLSEIEIPEGCMIVRSLAFQHCERLKKVIVKGINTFIEHDAFLGCPELEIICKGGSFAEKYAFEIGQKYRLMNENGDVGDTIIPVRPSRTIVIDSISVDTSETKTRLSFKITIGDEETDTLWYEVENKWKKYLCDDRCDGIVVSLLLFAIRGRYYSIKSSYPISKELFYRLTYHLIPEIVDFEGSDKATAVKLEMPLTSERYPEDLQYNGTGFSRGVDSFTTLFEYGHTSEVPENYKIKVLNVYNVGAFHGKDAGMRSFASSKELFEEQVRDTIDFGNKYGYNVLIVDSNFMLFVRDHFNGSEYANLRKFQSSATERNIGTTLLFQKLFRRFYYASGHKMKEFKLSLDESSALWEQYGVQFFDTENTTFFISNRNWSRMDKIKRVALLPEAYDNLQVCLVRSHNCGKCMKCRRTLMNLDVLGEDVLNRFAGSFDLKEYKEHDREIFFRKVWFEKDVDEYASDILEEAIKKHHPLISDPPVQKTNKKFFRKSFQNRISVKEYPIDVSKELLLLTGANEDPSFKIVGKCPGGWLKAEFTDGRVGFINREDIAITDAFFEIFSFRTIKKVIRSCRERGIQYTWRRGKKEIHELLTRSSVQNAEGKM